MLDATIATEILITRERECVSLGCYCVEHARHTANYDPQHPWLKRICADTGKIACGTVTYVVNLRSLGRKKENCWHVIHQTGSRLGYPGIQNAQGKQDPRVKLPELGLGRWLNPGKTALE